MKMTKLNVSAAVAAASLFGGVAQAQITTTSPTSVNLPIPDGNPVGLTSSTTISSVSGAISSISVNLDITGGFNGDLYAYLVDPNGDVAILLNRVGVSGSNSFGYTDAGFDVTLSDGSPNIHDYQSGGPGSYTLIGGQLTGTWGADGRNIDPQSSPATFDTTTPSATPLYDAFGGKSADGTWTLFVADLSSGGQATMANWALSVVTVPEPQTWALAASGVGMLLVMSRRRKA